MRYDQFHLLLDTVGLFGLTLAALYVLLEDICWSIAKEDERLLNFKAAPSG